MPHTTGIRSRPPLQADRAGLSFSPNSPHFGPMGYTSKEVRWSIIAKWKALDDMAMAARELELPLKLVRRWVQRYQATGDVEDALKSGRRPALSVEAAKKAHDLMLYADEGGAKAVAQHLHADGDTSRIVDKKTIIRATRKLARQRGVQISALRGKPRKMLTQATMNKRLQFSQSNLTRGWSNVMFTDRKKFPFSYPGEKVHAVTWAEKGARREARTVNHAQVVNAYAGISRYGVTDFHTVAGSSGEKTSFMNKKGQVARNITAHEYGHVVKATLLPGGQKMFSGNGMGTWVMQQDNDPTHKAALPVVKQWNAQHASSVTILPQWPPNSPDLNPIENFWSLLQARMDAKGCKSFSEFKAALPLEARAVKPQYFSNLVASMPKRLARCTELGGGKTRY